jgi:hypothetical protein
MVELSFKLCAVASMTVLLSRDGDFTSTPICLVIGLEINARMTGYIFTLPV